MLLPFLAQLLDGAGQQLTAAWDDIVYAGYINNTHLVRCRKHPTLVFKLDQYCETGSPYQPISSEFVATLPKFYAERLSVYTVQAQHLVFSHNLSYDTTFLSWVLRKPGDYVIFGHDTVLCLQITGTKKNPKHEFISALRSNYPISHSLGQSAWY